MNDRVRRVGLNEALFRQVNEKIEDLNRSFGTVAGTMTIVCECGDGSCTQQIETELALYERVRADPRLFALVAGHEDPAVEEVVEQHDGVAIVRKRPGEPGRIAEATDPRG